VSNLTLKGLLKLISRPELLYDLPRRVCRSRKRLSWNTTKTLLDISVESQLGARDPGLDNEPVGSSDSSMEVKRGGHLLSVSGLERLDCGIVQFDDRFGNEVAGTSDRTGHAGCKAWEHDVTETRKNLERRMARQVFLGLSVSGNSGSFTDVATGQLEENSKDWISLVSQSTSYTSTDTDLGTEAVGVFRQLDQQIGIEIDTRGRAAIGFAA